MNIETQKQNRQIGMLVQDFTSQVVDFYITWRLNLSAILFPVKH